MDSYTDTLSITILYYYYTSAVSKFCIKRDCKISYKNNEF